MKRVLGWAAVALLAGRAVAGTATIDVDVKQPGPKLNPAMYGIFLEEINHGVDGGLYAELIRNRGFEGNNPPEGSFQHPDDTWCNRPGQEHAWNTGFRPDPTGLPYWHVLQQGGGKSSATLVEDKPLNSATPHSCLLQVDDPSGRVGLINDGYWGIGVRQGEKYNLSFHARCAGFAGPLTAVLEDDKGQPCSDSVRIEGIDGDWKKLTATLTGTRTEGKARFVLLAGSRGKVWLDMVSLFPARTWRNEPNGLRADIAQLIADLSPSFVRYPGGCVVEGGTPETAYNWKWTVGPLEQRREAWNCWGYRRTHGMGMFEYLRFCQNMKAEPLFVAFGGQTCYFRWSVDVPKDQMGWVIDGAVDAMDYANAPPDSKWGKVRADAGHPAPFNMKLIGLGNENSNDRYLENYADMYKAVKARYPDATTIACVRTNKAPVDMVDDHFYRSPRWFMNTKENYDGYDRKGPPVYIGEVSTYSLETHQGRNILAGLSEGMWMLGLERNADVVKMVSYAPLLAHVSGQTGWHGMIYFDSLRSFVTPSYHVQKLFSVHRPTYSLKTSVAAQVEPRETVPGRVHVNAIQLGCSFKDLRIEKEGRVLLAPELARTPKGWEKSGEWKAQDGALTTERNGGTAFGEPGWADYTVSLKMRREKCHDPHADAFILQFASSDQNRCEWKIDADGKGSSVVACDEFLGRTPVDVGIGQWHEMRVEMKGLHIRCLLDGKVVHEGTIPSVHKFAALAGRDEATGDIIIKAINSSPEPVAATISLANAGKVTPQAEATVLKGESLADENTMEQPQRIAPAITAVQGAGERFQHVFPATSMTVLRIRCEK